MRKSTIGVSVSYVSPMLRAYIKLLAQRHDAHNTTLDRCNYIQKHFALKVTAEPVVMDWELIKQLVPKTLP